ncbi:Baculoviral IAP repeat-containing protein 7-B [Bulinus truncatus]|nr:Baculoviral IAP repeat-containing protein 7-B [Bulinus truncatus]
MAVNIERLIGSVVVIPHTQVGGHGLRVPSGATYVAPTDQTTAVNIERPNVVAIQRTQVGGHGLCVPSGATYVVPTDQTTAVNIERPNVVAIQRTQVRGLGLCVPSGATYVAPTDQTTAVNIERPNAVSIQRTQAGGHEPCVPSGATYVVQTDHLGQRATYVNTGNSSPDVNRSNTGLETIPELSRDPRNRQSINEIDRSQNLNIAHVMAESELSHNVVTSPSEVAQIESYINGNVNTERVSASQLHLVIRPDASNELTSRGFEREQDASNDLSGLASGGATDTPTNSGMINGKKENVETGDQHGVDVTSLTRIKNNNKPKRILMAPRIRRWKSFDSCPYHIKDKKELALAGLYYEGRGDCTRCFHCGGGLTNWEKDDDVWVEHAKWFPKCGYLQEQMGEEFILAVQELKVISEKITLLDVMRRMAENTTARAAQLKCKKCNDRNIEVTFYGCGHMACYYCSHIDKNSPCHVCGRKIMGRLPTKIK